MATRPTRHAGGTPIGQKDYSMSNQPVAHPNSYGITYATYATSMTGEGKDLRSILAEKNIPYRETSLPMGTMWADPACLITYKRSNGQDASVLIFPVGGIPDDWCEEYYYMLGVDHDNALTRNWPQIIGDVRKLYNPAGE